MYTCLFVTYNTYPHIHPNIYVYLLSMIHTHIYIHIYMLIYYLYFILFLIILMLFIFERERERKRDRTWVGEGQRERETQNLKQTPGSEPSAQSPHRAWTHEPWDHDLGDVGHLTSWATQVPLYLFIFKASSVPNVGLELTTLRPRVTCFTNWDSQVPQ